MGGLFKTPKMPEVEPPTPLPDEEETSRARRRTLAAEQKTGGLASTYLKSGGRETFGG